MEERKKQGRALGSAAIVATLGVALLTLSMSYRFGSLVQPGPGFLPRCLGVGLIALGALVALRVPARRPDFDLSRVRPLACIVAAVLAFALLIDVLGLFPAIFASMLLASFGDRTNNPRVTAAVAAGMCLFGWLVFIEALGLPFDPIRLP